MDDAILWQKGGVRLSARLQDVSDVLRTWVFMLNTEKCKVYQRKVVPKVDVLTVMGLPCELIGNALSLARSKFWKLKHLSLGKTPLSDRLTLFDRVVTPSALWCASAVIPDRASLQLVNRHLMRFVCWMANVRRKPDEGWLSHHVRQLRAARAMVWGRLKSRWSTKWLRRTWNFMGHVARGMDKEFGEFVQEQYLVASTTIQPQRGSAEG